MHSFHIVLCTVWLSVTGFLSLGFFIALVEGKYGDACIMSFAVFLTIGGLYMTSLVVREMLHDRWLLTHGVLSQGHIHSVTHNTQNDRETLSALHWSFRDNLNHAQKGTLKTFNKELFTLYPIGTEIEILFDPTDPSRSVAPCLMRATFPPTNPIIDNRPELKRTVLATKRTPTPITATHNWFLDAIPTRARGGCLGFGINSNTRAGQLQIYPQGLCQIDSEGNTLAAIFWDTPFTLQLTVWPFDHDRLELGMTFVQRGTKGRIRFQVELPQKAADHQLPIQQLKAPYLDTNALLDLWQALEFYAQIHGDDLRGKLHLD